MKKQIGGKKWLKTKEKKHETGWEFFSASNIFNWIFLRAWAITEIMRNRQRDLFGLWWFLGRVPMWCKLKWSIKSDFITLEKLFLLAKTSPKANKTVTKLKKKNAWKIPSENLRQLVFLAAVVWFFQFYLFNSKRKLFFFFPLSTVRLVVLFFSIMKFQFHLLRVSSVFREWTEQINIFCIFLNGGGATSRLQFSNSLKHLKQKSLFSYFVVSHT